jgi:hypothetical protein
VKICKYLPTFLKVFAFGVSVIIQVLTRCKVKNALNLSVIQLFMFGSVLNLNILGYSLAKRFVSLTHFKQPFPRPSRVKNRSHYNANTLFTAVSLNTLNVKCFDLY